ncbi:hypothetical protein, partial [Serratia marcescens]|uniref:hypothetical protein n=1 Tax=Serratia marcescens TaxID=615 RepID=UPI0019538C4A
TARSSIALAMGSGMYAGTGVGGIAYPYIMSGLLNSVGYKAALVSMGIGYAIIGSIALIPLE